MSVFFHAEYNIERMVVVSKGIMTWCTRTLNDLFVNLYSKSAEELIVLAQEAQDRQRQKEEDEQR